MGYKRGDCVHWPAIERALGDGPADTGALTVAMYGADDRANRAAAALVLMRMARQERVVRIRAGFYGLPGKTNDWPVFNRETLTAYLSARGRTANEIACYFGISRAHAWRSVMRLGVKLEVRRAHPTRWSRFNSPCWTYKIRYARGTRPPVVRRPWRLDGFHECPRCGEVKPRTPEHYYFTAKGYIAGYCKPCHRDWNIQYLLARPRRRGRAA